MSVSPSFTSFPKALSVAADQVLSVLTQAGANWKAAFLVLAALYALQLVNWLSGYRLNRLGLIPRNLVGLRGILLAPVLHADFNHLFFNSLPLFTLLGLLFNRGVAETAQLTLQLMVLGGGLLWLIGQRGIHIGASGLIMGYIGYLLAEAYFNPSVVTILVAGVVLFYFGSSLFSIFPQANKQVSWQGHLTGLASGIIVALYHHTHYLQDGWNVIAQPH